MAITVPTWFDSTNYLNVKTEQLNTTKFQGKSDWTNTTTEAALAAAGFTPYEHFMEYGNAENISPNSMFNVAEYLLAKANQLNADKFEGKTDWTEASVMAAFEAAGLSAWDHYSLYGTAEGNNPSNAFDTNAYLTEKLAQLKATEPDANWTMEGVIAAFEAAGVNPLEHYQLYGKTEGLTAPAVPHGEIVVSNFNPYTPANPGEAFTLTTAKDTITGTAGNDTVTGVASSLTSEQTLNNTDVIDGAAGTDTINVNMKGNFNGFTTGSMTNVEIVNLTNTGTINHTFDAKGITGVETYNIDARGAAVNLRGLDSADNLTVNVKGQAQGTANIEFTAKAIEGTSDSLNLGLSSVGTAAVGTTAQSTVTVNANGIENLNVKVTDNNFVNLTNAATNSITASGAGSLTVTAVKDTLTSFDATNMSGNVNANLSANVTGGISTVKGGSGDDTFTVASNGLASTATIDGGAGTDSLVVSGGGSLTLQPTMNGIENVTAAGGVTLTLSGKNVSGLGSVTVMGTSSVTLAGVQASDFAINTQGAASGTVIMDTATALTVNTKADSTITNAVTADITASKATTATVNVGVDTQVNAGSEMNFAVATDVTVNVAQSFAANGTDENTLFDGTINAGKAASLNVNAKGLLGSLTGATAAIFNVNEATSVTVVAEKGGVTDIMANKATDVSITAGADLNIVGSTLGAAQNVTLVQNAGTLTGTSVNLTGLNTLNVSGAGTATGKESAVILGTLGNANYGLTVNASGLKGGFTADAVAAGLNAVNLNFADVTGAATVASIAGGDITIIAADTGTTVVSGTITATNGNVVIDGIGLLGGSKTVAALDLDAISAMGENKSIDISFDGGSDVEIGALTTSITTGTINIDASGYLGSYVGAGAGTAANAQAIITSLSANTVNIMGSDIGVNDFSTGLTANTLTFTSGLQADKVAMTGQTGAKTMTATLNTGAGNDAVTLTGTTDTTSIVATGNMGGNGDTTTGDSITIGTGAAAGFTIDISGLTGYVKSTLTGGVGKDIIKGGADNDTITGGAGNDIITLGGGNDKVVIGGYTANGVDSITGFATGDKVVFKAVADGAFTKISTAIAGADLDAALATFIASGGTNTLGVNSAVAFTHSGKTYLLIDGDATAGYLAAGDAVVELVGVSLDQAFAMGHSIFAAA